MTRRQLPEERELRRVMSDNMGHYYKFHRHHVTALVKAVREDDARIVESYYQRDTQGTSADTPEPFIIAAAIRGRR